MYMHAYVWKIWFNYLMYTTYVHVCTLYIPHQILTNTLHVFLNKQFSRPVCFIICTMYVYMYVGMYIYVHCLTHVVGVYNLQLHTYVHLISFFSQACEGVCGCQPRDLTRDPFLAESPTQNNPHIHTWNTSMQKLWWTHILRIGSRCCNIHKQTFFPCEVHVGSYFLALHISG